MINERYILRDDVKDAVASILGAMNAIDGWTTKKRSLKDELLQKLSIENYIAFSATNPNRYHIQAIGQHYLYDVPLYKQGVLKVFRGKRVRIICTHSGNHTWRGFMAGAVCETPKNLLIEKLSDSYTFPSCCENNEILYQSPRYRAVKLCGNERFDTEENLVLESSQWDCVVIDGYSSKIVAYVNTSSEQDVQARGRFHTFVTTHKNIRSVVERYAHY